MTFLLSWIISGQWTRNTGVSSVISWFFTAVIGFLLFVCFHMIIGGKHFHPIDRPFVEGSGIASALMALGTAFLALLFVKTVGGSAGSPRLRASPLSLVDVIKQNWRGLLLYSCALNGVLVFGAGFVAAWSLPTVGALINGKPPDCVVLLRVVTKPTQDSPPEYGPASWSLDSRVATHRRLYNYLTLRSYTRPSAP